MLSSRRAPRRRIRSWLHGCALVVIAVAAQACLVVSLQPAYDAASVAFDDALVGRWQNAADQTSATVERAEWRAYKIAYTDRFATLTFHANLTRIGPASFLDLTQVRGSDEGPYLLPVHGVLRVNADAETLTVEALDYGWFLRGVGAAAPAGLATSVDDRRNVVMTAPTADVRRWLARAPDQAFSAAMTFARVK